MNKQLLLFVAVMTLSGSLAGQGIPSPDIPIPVDNANQDDQAGKNPDNPRDSTAPINSRQQAKQEAQRLGVGSIDQLQNMQLISSQSKAIGTVQRFATDRISGELVLVIDPDGSFDATTKEIVVPVKSVQKTQQGQLTTTLTTSQLQQERDIEPWTPALHN